MPEPVTAPALAIVEPEPVVISEPPPAEPAIKPIVIGVDEGWEVCLLKFAADLIQQSAGENSRDFRRRGLF